MFFVHGTHSAEDDISPERKRKGRFVERKVVALGRIARLGSTPLPTRAVDEEVVELPETVEATPPD